jgi:pimeloyl-ACP methyl ester carboxylesterase
MEIMADCIKFLCDTINAKKIILAGHSMGGYVALAIAERYPEMVKGICLINSSPFEDDPKKKINRTRSINLVKSNHNVFLGDTIKNLFSKEYFHLNLRAVGKTEKIAEKTSIRGIIAALEGMKERKDRSFILKKMKQNCFCIFGAHDLMMPEIIREKISKILPENNIHILLKSGHMSLLEEKMKVNIILEKIFNEIQSLNH